MNLIYIYMNCVSHENRYILDRMMHIFWVLSILVLIQFHLLHISSFSYVSIFNILALFLFLDQMHARLDYRVT